MLCTVQNVKLLKVYASNKIFCFYLLLDSFMLVVFLLDREIETADLLQPGSYFWCSLQSVIDVKCVLWRPKTEICSVDPVLFQCLKCLSWERQEIRKENL